MQSWNVDPSGYLKRLTVAGLYGLGLLGVVQLWLSFMTLTGRPTDFIQEYLLGCAFGRGLNPGLPVKELASLCDPTIDTNLIPRNHSAAHPPIWGILLYPLSMLSFADAQKVWFLVVLVTMFGIFRALTRQSYLNVMCLTAASSLTFPVAAQLQLGQVDAMTLLCFSVALCCLEKRRDGAAGGLIGLAMALKLSGWLVWVWLVCAGKRRVVVGALLGLAGLQVIQLAGFGARAMFDYYTVTTSGIGRFYQGAFDNLSVLSLPMRVFHGMHSKVDEFLVLPPILLEAPALVPMLSLASALAGALLALYAARRLPCAAAFTMCVAASQLFSPVVWSGSFVSGLMVFALTYERCIASLTRFAVWTLGLCIFATAPFFVPADVYTFGGSVTIAAAWLTVSLLYLFIPLSVPILYRVRANQNLV